jgi:hypothetical protein
MKRIILEKDEQTIDVTELGYIRYPLIGACDKSSKQKDFVVMTEFENRNSHRLMCMDGFERGNHYDSPEFSGTLANIFKIAGYDFFLFDTPKELFAWLAE